MIGSVNCLLCAGMGMCLLVWLKSHSNQVASVRVCGCSKSSCFEAFLYSVFSVGQVDV